MPICPSCETRGPSGERAAATGARLVRRPRAAASGARGTPTMRRPSTAGGQPGPGLPTQEARSDTGDPVGHHRRRRAVQPAQRLGSLEPRLASDGRLRGGRAGGEHLLAHEAVPDPLRVVADRQVGELLLLAEVEHRHRVGLAQRDPAGVVQPLGRPVGLAVGVTGRRGVEDLVRHRLAVDQRGVVVHRPGGAQRRAGLVHREPVVGGVVDVLLHAASSAPGWAGSRRVVRRRCAARGSPPAV